MTKLNYWLLARLPRPVVVVLNIVAKGLPEALAWAGCLLIGGLLSLFPISYIEFTSMFMFGLVWGIISIFIMFVVAVIVVFINDVLMNKYRYIDQSLPSREKDK